MQHPTVVQTIQAPPHSRLEKLEKRTKKIKDLKGKGDTINVNSPGFQDALETPSGTQKTNVRIKQENLTPKVLSFDEVSKPKSFLVDCFHLRKRS